MIVGGWGSWRALHVTERQTDRPLTVVTAVVQQDHLVDQIGRRSVQHAATKSAVLRL
jgi:hypothetical protein